MGFNPATEEYICPYLKRQCTKRSSAFTHPYPVCTVKKPALGPICVCPQRFYAIDFLNDVVDNAWPGAKPANPKIATEVTLEGFGNVDFVVADTEDDESIKEFVSVELQAIDITGTVRDAYEALVANKKLEKKKPFSLNWKNVYKRYMHQLINKGYHHHHWNSRIVAVMQDEVYEYICKDAEFQKSKDISEGNLNIVFMTYKFVDDGNGNIAPQLARVEGTHHSALQSAFIYKQAPSRDEYCAKIASALAR